MLYICIAEHTRTPYQVKQTTEEPDHTKNWQKMYSPATSVKTLTKKCTLFIVILFAWLLATYMRAYVRVRVRVQW